MSEQQPKPAPSTPTPPPSTTPQGSTGLSQNVAGLLCYLVGWVTGIIFLIIEKQNTFVRFHAVQSIVFFGAVTVANIILTFIPVVGWIISWLIGVFAFIMWIILMVRAYQGKMWKLPIAGDIAEKNSKPAATAAK